jgi:hypothetical protein
VLLLLLPSAAAAARAITTAAAAAAVITAAAATVTANVTDLTMSGKPGSSCALTTRNASQPARSSGCLGVALLRCTCQNKSCKQQRKHRYLCHVGWAWWGGVLVSLGQWHCCAARARTSPAGRQMQHREQR